MSELSPGSIDAGKHFRGSGLVGSIRRERRRLVARLVTTGSPAPLSPGQNASFRRSFHVELLRGGMNRLLLRAMPTADAPSRIEVLFQYVQHLDIPMAFPSLEVEEEPNLQERSVAALLKRFPGCRSYRLSSEGKRTGCVIAAACIIGEDSEPAGADSMFPMMN